MRKNFSILILIIVIIGAAYFLVNNAFKSKSSSSPTPQSSIEKKDRKIIEQLENGTEVADLDAYAALIRTAKSKDPNIFALAEKFSNSENILYRQAVAQVLTYYDNEDSLEILERFLNDSELSVRSFAIKALAAHKSQDAIELLKSQSTSLKGEEKVTALDSLYQNSQDENEKSNTINKLLEEYKKNEKHSELAGLSIIRLAPNSETVQNFMRDVIENKTNSRVSVAALRILSNQKNQWVIGEYETIASWANNEVARALIQSLHRSCPENRWQILDLLVKPNSHQSVIRTALRELTLLPGPQATAFLEKIKSTHGNNPSIKISIEKTASQMKSGKLRNPCNKID